MTDQGLAALLAAHVWRPPTQKRGPGCYCGNWDIIPGSNDLGAHRQHAAHLADVILRDWLPTALADERVVEAATTGVDRRCQCPHEKASRDRTWCVTCDATAALTAAVTALTEEDA